GRAIPGAPQGVRRKPGTDAAGDLNRSCSRDAESSERSADSAHALPSADSGSRLHDAAICSGCTGPASSISFRVPLPALHPGAFVESSPGWGNQKDVTVGGRLKGMPVKEQRNDGTWRRMSVKAANPTQSLAVGITDAVYPEPGRVTFNAMIGLDCDLKFEQ